MHHPVPALVLCRLAVHKDRHKQGISTALLVHTISEQPRRLYLSRGFIDPPVKPMTLCLMLTTVHQAQREPQIG